MLQDSGYHTISPEQLYQYMVSDSALPSRPVIISFDDGHEPQILIAKPVLESHGFRAVFFIMTVCIDKKGFLSRPQIKKLSDDGHAIGGHTWDHSSIARPRQDQWEKQNDQSKLELEKITGRPIESFAFPYGVWNEKAIHEIEKRGTRIAFQLTDKQSEVEPLYTVRRMMVSGLWTGPQLQKKIPGTF